MRLKHLRLSSFQSFGPTPTSITFDPVTFLIGPNGSGKTAVLRALSRLFSVERQYRFIRPSDFHVSSEGKASSSLWIEADFDFPELLSEEDSPAVPDQYRHLTLESADAAPILRIRLAAAIDSDEEIDESVKYVTQVGENNEPTESHSLSRYDRTKIQVHYLPARRNPADHISFGPATLLGRILRATDWSAERDKLKTVADEISTGLLGANLGVVAVSDRLKSAWTELHKGTHYADPSLAFESSDLEAVLRNLSVSFSPGHRQESVDYGLLSDGQQSLLYLSLVLSAQGIYAGVLSGSIDGFDAAKLRPPTFSMVVMEEPENSLSPHYLGRVVAALKRFAGAPSSQAVVATHAPSMLRRVTPEHIRYLRLSTSRESSVRTITLPTSDDEARKFVKEAVQAYPELYFSRLVILGEGDSESIVIPRLLQASSQGQDDASVSVVPLGGRFVNHFWRLLHALDIPHLTLLDLDTGRHQAGWGRVRYVLRQIQLHDPASGITEAAITKLPSWNDPDDFVHASQRGAKVLDWLEKRHRVFFSSPLDLDYSMILKFAEAYGVTEDELEPPDQPTVKSVLGKSAKGAPQFSDSQQSYFSAYHRIFKLESKPVAHIGALSTLTDSELLTSAPEPLLRLLAIADAVVSDIPE